MEANCYILLLFSSVNLCAEHVGGVKQCFNFGVRVQHKIRSQLLWPPRFNDLMGWADSDSDYPGCCFPPPPPPVDDPHHPWVVSNPLDRPPRNNALICIFSLWQNNATSPLFFDVLRCEMTYFLILALYLWKKQKFKFPKKQNIFSLEKIGPLSSKSFIDCPFNKDLVLISPKFSRLLSFSQHILVSSKIGFAFLALFCAVWAFFLARKRKPSSYVLASGCWGAMCSGVQKLKKWQ